MANAPRTPLRPDRDLARERLEALWQDALGMTAPAVPIIDGLINHKQTSIRFCLLTQLLGKLVDNSLDAMCLQRR